MATRFRSPKENERRRNRTTKRTIKIESLENRQLLAGDLYAGDANQDYYVDESDLILVGKNGKFETGLPADWSDGDWNGAPGGTAGDPPLGDGEYNSSDLVAMFEQGAFRQGPYDDDARAPIHAREPLARIGDGFVSLDYDVETGRVQLDTKDNVAITTLQLYSESSLFQGDKPPNFAGLFDVFDPNSVFRYDPIGFSLDEFEIILPPGLSESELLADISVDGSLLPGGDIGAVGLTCDCLQRQRVAPFASGSAITETLVGELSDQTPEQVFLFETVPSDRVTVVLSGSETLNATVTLFSDEQPEIASATTDNSNMIILENVAAPNVGPLSIKITANDGQFGQFELDTIFNATLERETLHGNSNNTIETAERLEGTFFSVPLEMQASSVIGSLATLNDQAPAVFQETFESGQLSDAWMTASSHENGSVVVSDGVSAGEGDFSLLMDGDGVYPELDNDNDQIVRVLYDPSTGSISVDVPAGRNITTIEMVSNSQIFTGDAPPEDIFVGLFDVDRDDKLFKLDPNGFGDLILPNVASPGLSFEFLQADLLIRGAWVGGGLVDVELVTKSVWNEAIWTVDVSQTNSPVLSFLHAEWNDVETPILIQSKGSSFADGIAISDDGITWHRAWVPQNQEAGVWQKQVVDIETIARESGIALNGNLQIKFQQSGDGRIPNAGRGFDDIRIVSFTDQDWYTLTPESGEILSFVATSHDANARVDVGVYATDGTQLHAGVATQNANLVVNNFVSDGSPIHLLVTGRLQNYTLFSIRNGQFETEPNDTVRDSTPIPITGNVIGHADALDADWYGFVSPTAMVDVVNLEGLATEFSLESGLLGGERDQLQSIRVNPLRLIDGRYFLHVDDAAQDEFTFVIEPGEGGFSSRSNNIVVSSLYPIRSETVQAEALQIDNVPATKASIVDEHTVLFEFAEVVEGSHVASIAAGAISDVSGRTNAARTITYAVDLTRPTIVSTSISANETIPADFTTIEIEFSEAVQIGGPSQLTLEGSNGFLPAQNLSYDPATLKLSVDYDLSVEDEYLFRIGNDGPDFVDLAGHALDEPFAISFTTDITQQQIAGPFEPLLPLGSAAYQGQEFRGVISVDDTDEFAVQIDGNQVISASVTAVDRLIPEISIVAENGDILATSASSASSATVAAFAAEPGTYAIRVSSKNGTTGRFTADAFLNVVWEDDELESDTAAAAQPLGEVAADFGLGEVHQVTLLGTLDSATRRTTLTEGFESGTLPEGWSTAIPDERGRVLVSNEFGAGVGEFALVMDAGPKALAARRASVQLVYDPSTGELFVDTLFPLTTLEIKSASGIFTGEPAQNLDDQFRVDTDIKIFKLDPFGFDDFSFGNVTQTGLNYEFLAADLSIAGTWHPGGRADFDIVVVEEGVRTEAIWAVDLTGTINPQLRFQHVTWNDSATHLPIGFVGSVQGDGVSISVDGTNWYTAFTPSGNADADSWLTETVALQDVADFAEISLDGPVQIKFQHYGNGHLPEQGRGYDDIRILGDQADIDWFSVDLADGESLSLAAKNGSTDPLVLSVFDSAGQLLIETSSDSLATIQNFEDVTTDNQVDTYSVSVRNMDGTQSDYSLTATRNAGIDLAPRIVQPNPEIGEGVFIIYDSFTGQVDVKNLSTRIGFTTVELQSRTFRFIGDKTDHPGNGVETYFTGLFDVYNSGKVFKLDPAGFGDLPNFATVEPGLTIEQFIANVDINGAMVGGGNIRNAAGGLHVVSVQSIGIGSPFGTRDLTAFHSYVSHLAVEDSDPYHIELISGADITIETATPSDGPWQFDNLLNASVRILDQNGNVVATDEDGAADGRNAKLNFTAVEAGNYRIEVFSTETQGEYVINVSGDLPAPGFKVVASSISDGDLVNARPTAFEVQFNRNINVGSVQPEDLTIDGQPAIGFEVKSPDTISFELPIGLVEGDRQIKIAADAIIDLANRSSEALIVNFSVDAVAPSIIFASIDDNAVFDEGPFVVSVQFDEPIDLRSIATRSIELIWANGTTQPTNTSYDAATNTLTIDFGQLTEGSYELQISELITDLAGNRLQSGFRPSFVVLAGSEPYTGGYTPVKPFESFAFESELIQNWFDFGSDVDSITFELSANQLIDFSTSNPSGAHSVTLIAPNGEVIDSAESSAGYSYLSAFGREAGTYMVVLANQSGRIRSYESLIQLNMFTEPERPGERINDTSLTAQRIDDFFVGESVQVVTATGRLNGGPDWYAFNANDGERFSIGFSYLEDPVLVSVLDEQLNFVAQGSSGTNFDLAISEFQDATTDNSPSLFYILVEPFSFRSDKYQFTVSRDSSLESDSAVTPFGPSLHVLGSITAEDASDEYTFFAEDGGQIEVDLNVPYGDEGAPDYSLVASLRLVDPNGQEVATGENQIVHTATAAGVYRVQVVPESGSGGYSISVAGDTVRPRDVEIVSVSPENGARLLGLPDRVTLEFSQNIDPTTVDPTDLVIGNGSAVSVRRLSQQSYEFTIDPNSMEGDGEVQLRLETAAVLTFSGLGNLEFESSFQVDQTTADFDDDGDIDLDDLNTFCSGVAQHGILFDINQDGVFNRDDFNEILSSVFGTLPGDVNFDGVFNGQDLVNLFQSGFYETGKSDVTWSDGDFNCSGLVNSTDLVDAFMTGLYEENGAGAALVENPTSDHRQIAIAGRVVGRNEIIERDELDAFRQTVVIKKQTTMPRTRELELVGQEVFQQRVDEAFNITTVDRDDIEFGDEL